MPIKVNIVQVQTYIMLPDKCSVMKEGKQCVSPPEFIVSIIDDKDEYMVGVTCAKCKEIVSGKLGVLQNEGVCCITPSQNHDLFFLLTEKAKDQ